MDKIKLFCLPYAGGSSAVFNKWRQYLNKNIELCPLELAGRGRRIYDPLYHSVSEAVEDVFQMIGSFIYGSPYSVFGHSMGGLIAYELTQKIRASNAPAPLHAFFAGRGAPHVPSIHDEKNIYNLPEEEFKKEIIELGGTPKEFFEHPELLDVLLPMLRSDFKIAETYKRNRDIIPLDYDISVMIGKEEEISAEQINGWKEHTAQVCTIHYFPGEHFFINEQTERIVQIINRILVPSVLS